MPDGSVEVRCDSPDPTAEASLRHGWAELLSFARRGIRLLAGTTLARPGGPAILLAGDPIATSEVARELIEAGWALLSERPTPVTFDEEAILAQPRPAPLIVRPVEHAVSRSVPGTTENATAVLSDPDAPSDDDPPVARTTPTRPDTDAAMLDAARAVGPAAIGALVEVTIRHVGEDDDVELRGHDRFDQASRLHVAGVLRPASPPDAPASSPSPMPPASVDTAAGDEPAPDATLIVEHLRLAALPSLRLRFDRGDGGGAARRLLRWLDRDLEDA